MNRIPFFIIIFFFLQIPESAEFIGGQVSGILHKGDYVITESILVMENQKLTISPGCVLYFEPFCGIKVSGELFCKGTSSEPIFLTSKNVMHNSEDSNSSAEAFDWNGLEITNEAIAAVFTYTNISHCTFGIQVKSKKAHIDLHNVIFDDIGYSSLCRETKLIDVKPGIPFSINWKSYDNLSFSDEPFARDPDKKKKVKQISLAGSGTASLCGSIILILSSIMVNRSVDFYNSQKDPAGAGYYRQLFYKNRRLQYSGAALLALGVAGVGISFAFWK